MEGEVEEVESECVFRWKVREFSSIGTDRGSPSFRFCGRRWMLRLHTIDSDLFGSEGHIVLYILLLDPGLPMEVRFVMGIRTAQGGTEVWEAGSFGPGNRTRLCRGIERSELLRRRDKLLPHDVITLAVTLKVEEGSSPAGRYPWNHVASFRPHLSVSSKRALRRFSDEMQSRIHSSFFRTDRPVFENAYVRATAESNVADASVQTRVEDSVAGGGESESTEKTGLAKIAEDVGKLWPNSDHADVLLRVKDAEFKAHKTILAARTPALGAKFQHETVEKASGEVIIEDCEPEVFEQLLHYIYNGAPSRLTAENASALYVVADKYQVSEVKALCVRCMRDTVCLDTFFDTLVLSRMHREDELLEIATDFFSRNMVDVLKTADWQSFLHEHTTWANEFLIRAAELTTATMKRKKRC